MKVRINTSKARATAAKQRAALKQIPSLMVAATEMGAAFERANHTYKNRTGRLEASTVSKTVRVSGAEVRTAMGLYTDYGRYVYARGFSRIDEGAAKVQSAVNDALAKLNH